MIEAEWWEHDSLDELADAVAGDVGFIIESAVDARDASLIAVPGGRYEEPSAFLRSRNFWTNFSMWAETVPRSAPWTLAWISYVGAML